MYLRPQHVLTTHNTTTTKKNVKLKQENLHHEQPSATITARILQRHRQVSCACSLSPKCRRWRYKDTEI